MPDVTELQRIREAIARARSDAQSSEHRRGRRHVVLVDRDDLVTLAAVCEHWVDTIEAARERRAGNASTGEIVGCGDG